MQIQTSSIKVILKKDDKIQMWMCLDANEDLNLDRRLHFNIISFSIITIGVCWVDHLKLMRFFHPSSYIFMNPLPNDPLILINFFMILIWISDISEETYRSLRLIYLFILRYFHTLSKFCIHVQWMLLVSFLGSWSKGIKVILSLLNAHCIFSATGNGQDVLNYLNFIFLMDDNLSSMISCSEISSKKR